MLKCLSSYLILYNYMQSPSIMFHTICKSDLKYIEGFIMAFCI